MLTVTESAGQHMADLLKNNEAPEEAALRFVVQGQSLGLTLSEAAPDDQKFEHDGRTVLLLDEQVAGMLDERTLDTEQTEEGNQLSLSGSHRDK